MNLMLVTFKTDNYRYKRHSVVHNLFLSDLLSYLIERQADILSVAPNPIALSDDVRSLDPPISWPSYGQHKGYIQTLRVVS